MADALLLVRVDYQFTLHIQVVVRSGPLLSVVERGWPKALDFSLDLELNIRRMYSTVQKVLGRFDVSKYIYVQSFKQHAFDSILLNRATSFAMKLSKNIVYASKLFICTTVLKKD